MTVEELEAVGLRVKKLKWHGTLNKFAEGADGTYEIRQSLTSGFSAQITNELWSRFVVVRQRTEDAAMAACELDNATRIAGELERIEG